MSADARDMTTSRATTSPPAAQGPERSARRDLAHLVILVVPWAVFAWLWWRVALSTTAEDLLTAAGLVLLVAVLCVPATLLWIAHNVRIFRRKGQRTGRPAAPIAYATDWTRRAVVADWEAVRAAGVVIVDPGAARKSFLPGHPTPLAEEGPEDRVVARAGR